MQTAWEAIDLLRTGLVVELSLDHDLGDDRVFGRGVDVVDFLVEEQEIHGRMLWPRDGLAIHSANPAGRESMARTIRSYASRRLSVVESRSGGQPRFEFVDHQAEDSAPS